MENEQLFISVINRERHCILILNSIQARQHPFPYNSLWLHLKTKLSVMRSHPAAHFSKPPVFQPTTTLGTGRRLSDPHVLVQTKTQTGCPQTMSRQMYRIISTWDHRYLPHVFELKER